MIVRGRIHGRTIDLERPLDGLEGEVEVTVRPITSPPETVADLLALLATLPAGARTKDEIDKQIAEDRTGWQRG